MKREVGPALHVGEEMNSVRMHVDVSRGQFQGRFNMRKNLSTVSLGSDIWGQARTVLVDLILFFSHPPGVGLIEGGVGDALLQDIDCLRIDIISAVLGKGFIDNTDGSIEGLLGSIDFTGL